MDKIEKFNIKYFILSLLNFIIDDKEGMLNLQIVNI